MYKKGKLKERKGRKCLYLCEIYDQFSLPARTFTADDATVQSLVLKQPTEGSEGARVLESGGGGGGGGVPPGGSEGGGAGDGVSCGESNAKKCGGKNEKKK